VTRHKRSTPMHNKPENQLVYEWPYIAGSTCLLVLLVWQPFQPPALAAMWSPPQPMTQAMQRSLQEIDSNCYQVQSDVLSDPHCEDCGKDTAASARPDEEFEFSRSILTCSDIHRDALRDSDTNRPENMMIEVIKSNHSF